jgi:CubicO group peptidase (beta-lactamase class C family)
MTDSLLLGLILVTGCATNGRFASIDTRLRESAARDEFSGVVLVARGGSPELLRAYGSVSVETCFNLASASKMFTLVAVQQLLEAGKLRRQDRVATYIPSYGAAADVTVEQLMTHTSGLPSGIGPALFDALANHATLQQLIDAVAAPLDFAPGTRVQYSNLGFLLLGRIVEVVSQAPFEQYVIEHIAKPAGMAHTSALPTSCATPLTRGMASDEASKRPRQPFAPPRATPAGGWSSTAADLLHFAEALRTHRLVAADPEELGFADRRWDGHRMVGHNGGAPGMNAEVWMFPSEQHTLIVLSNFDPPTATHVADELAELLTGSAPPAREGKVRMIRR